MPWASVAPQRVAHASARRAKGLEGAEYTLSPLGAADVGLSGYPYIIPLEDHQTLANHIESPSRLRAGRRPAALGITTGVVPCVRSFRMGVVARRYVRVGREAAALGLPGQLERTKGAAARVAPTVA